MKVVVVLVRLLLEAIVLGVVFVGAQDAVAKAHGAFGGPLALHAPQLAQPVSLRVPLALRHLAALLEHACAGR